MKIKKEKKISNKNKEKETISKSTVFECICGQKFKTFSFSDQEKFSISKCIKCFEKIVFVSGTKEEKMSERIKKYEKRKEQKGK